MRRQARIMRPALKAAEARLSVCAPVKRRLRLRALNARWKQLVLVTDVAYQSASTGRPAALRPTASRRRAPKPRSSRPRSAPCAAHRGSDGIGWTELDGGGQQPEPDGYQFAGKRAEDVLRAWQRAT